MAIYIKDGDLNNYYRFDTDIFSIFDDYTIKPPIDNFGIEDKFLYYPYENRYIKQFLNTHTVKDTQLRLFSSCPIQDVYIENKGWVYGIYSPNMEKFKKNTPFNTNPEKIPFCTRIQYNDNNSSFLLLRDLPLLKLTINISDWESVIGHYGEVFKVLTYDKGWVTKNGTYYIPAFATIILYQKYIGRSDITLSTLSFSFRSRSELNSTYTPGLNQPQWVNGTSVSHNASFNNMKSYETDVSITGRLLAE